MAEKITVQIQCQEVVKYNQCVSMTQEQFDSLDSRLSSDDRSERKNAEEELAGWIDRREVFDADDFEVDGFEISEE